MDNHWTRYQGALLWTGNPKDTAPTEREAQEALHESGTMFARWTSHWDCATPTEWWWCIKDTPLFVNTIPAKHRYRINKGAKYFDVQIITPEDYTEEIYQVMVAAFAVYPKKYQPHLERDSIIESIQSWQEQFIAFGAFEKESHKLCGYFLIREHKDHAELEMLKVIPQYEKLEINAALVYAVVMHYNDRLSPDFYLVDGERNIKHQTRFFEYLIQYFEFRKAYCQLHIVYSPKMHLVVNLLHPFKGGVCLLGKFNTFFYNVYCVLKMETIRRTFE